MLEPSTLAFICIFLFMIHEFEEIICVRPYMQRNGKDKRFTNEMFIAGGNKVYPSTESIALMISEEFILSCIILFIGIIANSTEIVLAPFIGFTLHLIPHALEASRFPGWAPGSRTAVLMLLPAIAIIVAVIMTQPIQPMLLALWTMVIGAILVFNLRLLHSISGRFDQKIR
ncbi:MAG: HXXEE domain-containing protein [Candidatus Saccharimonas sp.]|nr:MAG: HXXEE domain-containing protein [Candidatus Saccharimonas sp.]